jgi:hypothetical protein
VKAENRILALLSLSDFVVHDLLAVQIDQAKVYLLENSVPCHHALIAYSRIPDGQLNNVLPFS